MPPTVPPKVVTDAVVAPATRITRRVEIYESDNVTLWPGIDQSKSRTIEGSVSVDGTRDERRSLDLTLENTDRAVTPRSVGLWYDKIIVPYRGVILPDGTTWEWPLGRFLIDNLSADNFPHKVKLSCRDFTKRMELSLFSVTTTFAAGTDISVVIAALAANCGCTQQSLPYDGTILTVDYTFDQGSSRWEAAKKIADDYIYDLFFDAYGALTMLPKVDPTTSAVVWTFKTGAGDGNLASIGRQLDDSNIFNHVIVVGGSSDSDTDPPYAEVVNDEPSSPTNRQRLGDRTTIITMEVFTTNAQCKKYAQQVIKVQGLESYQLSLDSIVFPWLEANTVVKVLDPEAAPEDPKNYLLDSFSIPLGLGTMSASGKRITIVGTSTP